MQNLKHLAGIAAICLVALAPLSMAKGNIVGIEGCTGSGSCGSTRVSEDNDNYYYQTFSQESNADCSRGIVYTNAAVAGSSEMCTSGDQNCTGCGQTQKPDAAVIKLFDFGGDEDSFFLVLP